MLSSNIYALHHTTQVNSLSIFCGIFRDQFAEKSADFMGIFGANFFTKKQSVKNSWFCGYFQGKFSLKLIGFTLIRPTFLMFFEQRSTFAFSTTIHSRNESIMANPLTSWLVPSFLQYDLRLLGPFKMSCYCCAEINLSN